MKLKKRRLKSLVIKYSFFIFPAIAVGSWLLFIAFNPPKPNSFNTNEINTEEDLVPKIIKIKARKIINSSSVETIREINLSDTIAYVDMWRSHWCTYYNDREFYFTPRINEMLQRLRMFNVPVVTISQLAERDYAFTKQRRKGRLYVQRGTIDVLENYQADQTQYHYQYVPKFEDICVYKDLTRYGRTRDNRLTDKITLAKDDIIVENFRESAESFVGLGKKTILVFGQHTNMCLMAVFLYCQQVGFDLIIVRDLVDTCWLYELENSYAKTHTQGNNISNTYFDTKIGSSIISYDLIRSLNHLASNIKLKSRTKNFLIDVQLKFSIDKKGSEVSRGILVILLISEAPFNNKFKTN